MSYRRGDPENAAGVRSCTAVCALKSEGGWPRPVLSSPKNFLSVTYIVCQVLCDRCCAPTIRRLHFFVLPRPSERLPARWQTSTDMWRLFQVGASPRVQVTSDWGVLIIYCHTCVNSAMIGGRDCGGLISEASALGTVAGSLSICCMEKQQHWRFIEAEI